MLKSASSLLGRWDRLNRKLDSSKFSIEYFVTWAACSGGVFGMSGISHTAVNTFVD